MSMKPIAIALILALPLVLAPAGVLAASVGNVVSSSDGGVPRSADFKAGEKAAMGGDFAAAVGYFTKVVNTDPTNADGYNLLGFSYRQLGNVELAFENYNETLKLDPNHLGTNEYIGELYLETGDLANAEKRLEVLDAACAFGCEAYTDLKTAIKKYKAAQSN